MRTELLDRILKEVQRVDYELDHHWDRPAVYFHAAADGDYIRFEDLEELIETLKNEPANNS